MKKISKLLSVILCLAMVLSFALVVSAEENDGAITSIDQLVDGNYIIIAANGYGMATYSNGWVLAEEGDSVNGSVWTLTVTENGVKIADSNGVYIAPKGGNSNGIKEGEYEWAVFCENGMFIFAGQGEDTVKLASNVGSDNKFRAYKNGTIESQGAEKYPYTFSLYPVESAPQPAGPVACEIPGTLEYTFETDAAASAGVMFQWTATADGELGVARMGENYMTNVSVNGTYGEVGDNGYIVKTNDVVVITVYGYGAGAISVPVTYVTSGSQDEAALGTVENPEILTELGVAVEKTLESGEYFYQFTAAAAGELTITTTGDGTHNMEVSVNGDTTKVYSNWDNDGAFIKLNVAAGDVLSLKVYFDFPGAGTINFTMTMPAAEIEAPFADEDNVKIYFPKNESYISATANDNGKKLLEADADNAAIFTVEETENGYYFICGGKYLTAGATGNSLTLEETANEYSLWVLEAAENGWFVKNVNAAYNEQPQYLEFYSGFTTYGKKDTADVTLYTYQFEVVEDSNVESGDAIFAVLAVMVASGLGLTAVVSKKK